MLKHPLMTF